MSKKWLFGLAICTLAMGAAGCDDDGDSSSCQEAPKIIQESKNLDTAVKADGVVVSDTMDLDNCEKYANNMLEYLKDDTKFDALVESFKDYKTGFKGGSFLNILCSTVNAIDVTNALLTINKDIEVGTTCGSTLSAEADETRKGLGDQLSEKLGNLKTVEGWSEVAHAASDEAQKQADSSK